jgi:hypothetical protein
MPIDCSRWPEAAKFEIGSKEGHRMRRVSCLAPWGLLIAAAVSVRGQQPLPATTVQLPTFSVFTVQTTVSVPDGGHSYLGGINRAAMGSVSRGLGNRAAGGSRLAGGVGVSATITDHSEIDRSLLAAAAARRDAAADPAAVKAVALSKSIPRADGKAGLPDSLAAIRERNAAAKEEANNEVAGYFAKAQEAEAAGKVAVAKVYYQMVARRAEGSLKRTAQERLTALSREAQNTTIR